MHPDPYYEPHSTLQRTSTRHIALVGFDGSQTHNVAAFLSSMTGMTLIELDQWVAHQAGCSVAQLYLQQGEQAWRTLESQCLKDIVHTKPYAIINLNQKILLNPKHRKLCHQHCRLFYIRKSAQYLFDEIIAGRKKNPQRFPYWIQRPPHSVSEVKQQLTQLQASYEVADDCIEANDLAPLTIARKILQRL